MTSCEAITASRAEIKRSFGMAYSRLCGGNARKLSHSNARKLSHPERVEV